MEKFIELHSPDGEPRLVNAESVRCVVQDADGTKIIFLGDQIHYRVGEDYETVKRLLTGGPEPEPAPVRDPDEAPQLTPHQPRMSRDVMDAITKGTIGADMISCEGVGHIDDLKMCRASVLNKMKADAGFMPDVPFLKGLSGF